MTLSTKQFQAVVWEYYRQHGRQLPWRSLVGGELNPYHVLVSELMLQQTQVTRVVPKYQEFLIAFPTIEALAGADLAQVLTLWSGLGYNRRAKFLWQAAQVVVAEHGGVIPDTRDELVVLPGVGANTAGAILAYAFNKPEVFVETNIRTVYLHHFFSDEVGVSDVQLRKKVSDTLEITNPREWYWALMDYGAHLKSTQPKHLHRALAHTKQSRFEGSARQLRGKALRLLAESPWSRQELELELADERASKVLDDLLTEGLIHYTNGVVSLG